MPRRRPSVREPFPWITTFVERDWPGRCSLERFRAWRASQRAQPGDFGLMADARRVVRRELQHTIDCPIHPLPNSWPTGWHRGAEKTTFTINALDGSSSVEDVENDSPRDLELREAFEQWLQRLN